MILYGPQLSETNIFIPVFEKLQSYSKYGNNGSKNEKINVAMFAS